MSNQWALGEVHTHAQRLVLTGVVAELGEFERRIGGAMCRCYNTEIITFPRVVVLFRWLSVAPAPIGHGIVTTRNPLQFARETGWPSG